MQMIKDTGGSTTLTEWQSPTLLPDIAIIVLHTHSEQSWAAGVQINKIYKLLIDTPSTKVNNSKPKQNKKKPISNIIFLPNKIKF